MHANSNYPFLDHFYGILYDFDSKVFALWKWLAKHLIKSIETTKNQK